MSHPLEDVARQMRDTSVQFTRMMGDLAASLSGAAHVAANDEQNMRDELDHLRVKLEEQRKKYEVSERNRERFRYALWVYLQERDGPAGTGAPTPETLKLIRDLIKELE